MLLLLHPLHRGLTDAVEVKKVDQDYLAKTWTALTDPNANLAAELRKFVKTDKPYEPPLKPWVKQLLGRDYIHLGRAAGQEADLYRELAFLLELLKLHVAVGKLHAKKQLELLGWLAEVDPQGPWAQLQAQGQGNDGKVLSGELQGLLLLLRRVQLFLPARLMKLLGVEVGRGHGWRQHAAGSQCLHNVLVRGECCCTYPCWACACPVPVACSRHAA